MPKRIWLCLAITKLQHAPSAFLQVFGIAGKKAASITAHWNNQMPSFASAKNNAREIAALSGLPKNEVANLAAREVDTTCGIDAEGADLLMSAPSKICPIVVPV